MIPQRSAPLLTIPEHPRKPYIILQHPRTTRNTAPPFLPSQPRSPLSQPPEIPGRLTGGTPDVIGGAAARAHVLPFKCPGECFTDKVAQLHERYERIKYTAVPAPGNTNSYFAKPSTPRREGRVGPPAAARRGGGASKASQFGSGEAPSARLFRGPAPDVRGATLKVGGFAGGGDRFPGFLSFNFRFNIGEVGAPSSLVRSRCCKTN